MRHRLDVALFSAFFVAFTLSTSALAQPADLVLRGGHIATMDPARSPTLLRLDVIYVFASRTLKNSRTRFFSRSRIAGSSGLRGRGKSTGTSLKITAGLVFIM